MTTDGALEASLDGRSGSQWLGRGSATAGGEESADEDDEVVIEAPSDEDGGEVLEEDEEEAAGEKPSAFARSEAREALAARAQAASASAISLSTRIVAMEEPEPSAALLKQVREWQSKPVPPHPPAPRC